MAVDTFIFKDRQITLFPGFTFIPKAAMGLSKTGDSFYCEHTFTISIVLFSPCTSSSSSFLQLIILKDTVRQQFSYESLFSNIRGAFDSAKNHKRQRRKR